MTETPLRTGHIGLNVTDLERSVGFYCDALQLTVLGRSDDADRHYAFLGRDGQLQLTLWQQSTDGFASDRAGLHHLSFEVADVEALQQVEQRLRGLGIGIRDDSGVSGEPSAGGQLFFWDPDGIRLEIYAAVRPSRPASGSADAPACGFF